MPEQEQYPDWLNSTLASDAAAGRNVLPDWIKTLNTESLLVGPAFLVLASQDDNQALTLAMAGGVPEGSVLVIAGMSTSKTATIGGLMALEIRNMGIAGLVTDGLVRDSREIRQVGLPVWCRGTTPIASFKQNPGVIGQPLNIGGVMVSQGDLIIADDDGVVVWPKKDIPELLERAKTRLDSDNVRLEKLQKMALERANNK